MIDSEALMLAEMREDYRDAFGRYPSRKQEREWLDAHPGAVSLWETVNEQHAAPNHLSEHQEGTK